MLPKYSDRQRIVYEGRAGTVVGCRPAMQLSFMNMLTGKAVGVTHLYTIKIGKETIESVCEDELSEHLLDRVFGFFLRKATEHVRSAS